MGYNDKAPASRIVKAYTLAWAGTGASTPTTPFGANVHHVRVISQINGYIAIEPSATSGTVGSTSTFNGFTYIAANTANGDYFAVTQGEVLTFTSTTTTSGNLISIAEMS